VAQYGSDDEKIDSGFVRPRPITYSLLANSGAGEASRLASRLLCRDDYAKISGG